MDTAYNEELIKFAEDVAHMMACKAKVDEIKRAQRIAPIHRKYNGDDLANALYDLRKAECEVKEWLEDILGLED